MLRPLAVLLMSQCCLLPCFVRQAFLHDLLSLLSRLLNHPAGCWLASNWAAFNKTGQMHEKYDAFQPGEYGGGGEYAPQVGFGWTNGVLLDLLHQGYRPLQ